MKKLTLSIGLVAAMLSAKSQDTTDIVITKTKIYEFEFKTTNLIKEYYHENNIVLHAIDNEVIKFHLFDDKPRTRKVFITYPDGNVMYEILDSENNIYSTKIGPFKLEIGNPKFIQKL